jgi:hypothetical protein
MMQFRHRLVTVIAEKVDETWTPTLSILGASGAVKNTPLLSQHLVLKLVSFMVAPVYLAQ